MYEWIRVCGVKWVIVSVDLEWRNYVLTIHFDRFYASVSAYLIAAREVTIYIFWHDLSCGLDTLLQW